MMMAIHVMMVMLREDCGRFEVPTDMVFGDSCEAVPSKRPRTPNTKHQTPNKGLGFTSQRTA